MKKQKKQKLLNVWNKLKKPLIILSFVGNIIFLLFIIVGCVGVKKKSTQAKAENSAISSLSSTAWIYEGVDIFTTPNGDSFDSFSNQSYIFTTDGTLPTTQVFSIENYNDVGDAYNTISFEYVNTENIDYAIYFLYRSPGNPSIEQNKTLFYSINRYRQPTMWINTGSPVIVFESFNNLLYDPDLITWFSTYFTLRNSDTLQVFQFTFSNQINYNAPFKTDLQTTFVTTSISTSQLGKEIIYNFSQPFLSNGQFYNRIRLWYWNGYGSRYVNSSGQVVLNDSGINNVYFGFMQYINTLNPNETTIEVNSRNSISQNGYSAINYGSTWLNDNYRVLLFQRSLTQKENDNLAQFNNNLVGSNGFTNVGDNIGLSNVFTLISSGFGAFINVMKIEILPGLSLGLLCFLPLILIVIIVIIRLVKK